MPVDITVQGAEDLARVAKALRQVGDKELKRELSAGLSRATGPLIGGARRSAEAVLPRRGGLGKRVARGRVTTRRRTVGGDPDVRIEAFTGRGADAGVVRHPVFQQPGRPVVQVSQRVTPGWFTRPMEAGADEVARELVKVIDGIVDRLDRLG